MICDYKTIQNKIRVIRLSRLLRLLNYILLKEIKLKKLTF